MSNQLRDMDSAVMVGLRVRALAFGDDPLWRALSTHLQDERNRILGDMENPNTPAERLKFNQGELAQANRDIMLVEHFLRAIDGEQKRRRLAQERG